MKKKILTSVFIFASIVSFAQTINVHFKNGTKVEFNSSNVDYLDFSEKPADPTLTSGEYVDLGLSVKWASVNLGASLPQESGNYYAWGETSPKEKYTAETYAYYNSSTTTYTDIGDDISGTSYDAATVNLGKNWRIPTIDEMNELKTKCTWQWTQKEGVNGYLVTGTNGNSIFLPAAGMMISSSSPYYKGMSCHYLTSTSYNGIGLYCLSASSSGYNTGTGNSYTGYPIRPVYSEIIEGGIENITDYISIARTEIASVFSASGIIYTVTFAIKNSSSETVHLSSLGGVDISCDLEAGETYSVKLQSSSQSLQNNQQTLVLTYNGKSYSIQG